MDRELCFFLEVKLDTQRTATIHKLLTEKKSRFDKFNEFKKTGCYTESDDSFWRGPYWGHNQVIAYASIHSWTPILCDVCFPVKDCEGVTANQWAVSYFESKDCEECGGDREAHDIVLLEGHWFAQCRR